MVLYWLVQENLYLNTAGQQQCLYTAWVYQMSPFSALGMRVVQFKKLRSLCWMGETVFKI